MADPAKMCEGLSIVDLIIVEVVLLLKGRGRHGDLWVANTTDCERARKSSPLIYSRREGGPKRFGVACPTGSGTDAMRVSFVIRSVVGSVWNGASGRSTKHTFNFEAIIYKRQSRDPTRQ